MQNVSLCNGLSHGGLGWFKKPPVKFLKCSWLFVKRWLSVGQVVVTCWSGVGQALVKHWSGVGQVLVKRWSSVGQVLVKHWSGVGQAYINTGKAVYCAKPTDPQSVPHMIRHTPTPSSTEVMPGML